MEQWGLLQFLAFAAFAWTFGSMFMSIAGGWAALSIRFRHKGRFTGSWLGLRSVQMRLRISYSVEVGANPEGLYLSVLPLLRLGHPPLLIPWREVWVGRKGKTLWFHYVELEVSKDDRIPLRISRELAERLKQVAGSAWVDPTEPTNLRISYSDG